MPLGGVAALFLSPIPTSMNRHPLPNPLGTLHGLEISATGIHGSLFFAIRRPETGAWRYIAISRFSDFAHDTEPCMSLGITPDQLADIRDFVIAHNILTS